MELQGTDLTARDERRLSGLYAQVVDVMADGQARTADEIADLVALRFGRQGVRPESVNRMLRYMREAGWMIEKIHLEGGLFSYRATPRATGPMRQATLPLVTERTGIG